MRLFAILTIGLTATACTPVEVVTRVVDNDPPPVCQEDEPCWDCHTMGNLICGPGAGE